MGGGARPSRAPAGQPLQLAKAPRAQLSTPPQLEPDRAGSRHGCSLVPLLACPCNAGDVTPRHFLGRFRIADLKVASSSLAGRASDFEVTQLAAIPRSRCARGAWEAVSARAASGR
jgi:hypothetical protein